MKRDWIYKETHVFLTDIFQRTNLHEKVVMLDEAFKQGFTCRQTNCERQFQLHSTRIRYCHHKINMCNTGIHIVFLDIHNY